MDISKTNKIAIGVIFAALATLVTLTLLINRQTVPNKPISEHLTYGELAKAVKKDSTFGEFYTMVRDTYDYMDTNDQTKVKNLTYRQVHDFYLFLNDTAYWNPLVEQWKNDFFKDNDYSQSRNDTYTMEMYNEYHIEMLYKTMKKKDSMCMPFFDDCF